MILTNLPLLFLAVLLPLSAAGPAGAENAPGPVKDWTIMVFMNGKNDLTMQVEKDLNEMETQGPPAGMTVVVEAGRAKPEQAETGQWTGVRRYEILKDTDPASVGSRLLQSLSGADMGSWKHLSEFGRWAKLRYPARNYMLIVWNHGNAWRFIAPRNRGKAISFDEESGSVIDIAQLAAALKEMGGVDVYASDACLMQMAEITYELAPHSRVIVGSAETEPVEGWNYSLLLESLAALGERPSPKAVGAAAVEAYNRFYSPSDSAATLSALDAAAARTLREKLDDWAALAMAAAPRRLLLRAGGAALSYKREGSKDLVHFLTLAGKIPDAPSLAAGSEELAGFIRTALVYKNAASGPQYGNSGGLGIYLPMAPVREEYQGLSWAKDGKWDEFLNWLIP